jgi:hypothetical protein
MIIVAAKRGALQSGYGRSAKIVDRVFSLTEHVYFYRDYWCYAAGTRENYEFFKENFILDPVVSEENFERDYVLYRVTRKELKDSNARK